MKTTRYREFLSVVPSPGVRLCALESGRYKTIRARVFFLDSMVPGTATANSLLAHVLRTGCISHPSRRELARACEELYGAALSVGVTRFADVQSLVGTIEFPADRFLPKGSKELEQALALLCEVLTQPALDGATSVLRAENVEQEKFQLEQELNALQDDKPSWSALLAAQRTYAGTPGAIYEHGRVEDLPGLDATALTQRHRLLLGNAQVMAFVTGPVREERALKALAKVLKLPAGKRPALKASKVLTHRKTVARDRVKAQTEQTHLHFAWTGAGVYGRADFAPSLFADALFGGMSTSRLFKIVREKHGLAYAVHSNFQRARGVIGASAAVDPAKAEKALKLIRSELARLAKGGFSDEEFATARESLIESRKSAMDSMGARASDAVLQHTMGFKQKPEAQIAEIKKVKPAQVRAILKRLRPHTEFRLG
ncbi:MAG: insulinase family protein [Planctomycetes bacterium]|nr:insulinase family protein [Planctomycetota bacterium]